MADQENGAGTPPPQNGDQQEVQNGNGDVERSPVDRREQRGEDENMMDSRGDRSPAYRRDGPTGEELPSRRDERERSPPRKRPPPPPPGRDREAQKSNVLGCFGLSIKTRDIDLEDEFNQHGHVEKAVIVYDQRSERSRGFGFVTMRDEEEAERCIQELNGIELHGRNIRVAYSLTTQPHQSTPGEYMGFKTNAPPRRYDDRDRRDRYDRGYDRRDDRGYDRRDDRGYGRSRDYGRDAYDDRRAPPRDPYGDDRRAPRRDRYDDYDRRDRYDDYDRRDRYDDRAPRGASTVAAPMREESPRRASARDDYRSRY